MATDDHERLRALPAVHTLQGSDVAARLAEHLPREAVRTLVQGVIATLREDLLASRVPGDRAGLEALARERLEALVPLVALPRLRRVINATGVVLHTNLGRAPLGDAVLAHVTETSRGYATLEYDLEAGSRGHRDRLVSTLCATLFGGEDALVVNNNAAAVLLVATALGAGRDVIVSRGELVEIGGGFRIPEILAACGARLVEVGTTNRTRLADYERAVGPDTAMLLKVHRSNFAMVGFTASVEVPALVTLGRSRGVPVVEDLGSGALLDLSSYGLPAEPRAQTSLEAGVDLVMVSGDKLLGGPQAGILVGGRVWIERLRAHPLARAMRPGRLVFSALEATLRSYAAGRALVEIPAVRMLTEPAERVRARAERIASGTGWDVTSTEARVGGGAMPEARIPSWGVVRTAASERMAGAWERLLRREGDPPVIARISASRVILDARTIRDDEVEEVRAALARMREKLQDMGVEESKEQAGGSPEPAVVDDTDIDHET